METRPISKNTLNLFTGREKELTLLEKIIRIYNIVIIEGDYGVGKTSLGNYYRFNSTKITSVNEISTNPNWNTREFLNNVIKNILENLNNENLFQMTDLVKYLNLRYYINEDVTFNPNILGNSIGYESSSNKQELLTESGLIYDLQKLVKLADKHQTKIIIQLNNLDIGKTMKEEELLRFFGLNRNIFQLDNIQWILTGSKGLTKSFKKDLPKFGSIIGKEIYLDKISDEKLKELVFKRQKQINDKILTKVIKSKQGDIRSVLNIVDIIKTEKLNSDKKLKDYFDLFDFDEYEMAVLNEIKENSLSQTMIAKKLKVSKETVRKRINKLLRKSAVIKENSKYTISFEAYCSLL